LVTRARKGGQWSTGGQVLSIFIWTFVLAVVFSLLSETVLRSSTLALAGAVLVLIVLIGILFDIIGLATATADRITLNAMAAKRVPGARQGLRMVRNAPRVTAICNDLVGDICGTVSGAAGAAIVLRIGLTHAGWVVSPGGYPSGDLTHGIWTVLMVALVAAVTVGGKAAGKNVAIARADEIVFRAGRVLWWVESRLGLVLLRERESLSRNAKRKVTTS